MQNLLIKSMFINRPNDLQIVDILKKYIKKQLPLAHLEEVGQLIKENPDFETLYEDVKLFFDEDENKLHEILYQEEIDETIEFLSLLGLHPLSSSSEITIKN